MAMPPQNVCGKLILFEIASDDCGMCMAFTPSISNYLSFERVNSNTTLLQWMMFMLCLCVNLVLEWPQFFHITCIMSALFSFAFYFR